MKRTSKSPVRRSAKPAVKGKSPQKNGVQGAPPKRKGRPKKKTVSEADIQAEIAARQQKLLDSMASAEGFALLSEDEVETLIDVPNRKKLVMSENMTENHGLFKFARKRQFQYKRFLQLIREGASFLTACLASDIGTKKTVAGWIEQGIVDAEAEVDSYFSRFFRDVSRVSAIRCAEVESMIVYEDPKFWLRNGPGRLINSVWRDDPASKSTKAVTVDQRHSSTPQIPEADILNAGSYQISDQVEEDDEAQEGPPVDDNAYSEALAAMRAAGVLESPEVWEKHLRMQAGEGLTTEELAEKPPEETYETLGSNQLLLTNQQREAQSSS